MHTRRTLLGGALFGTLGALGRRVPSAADLPAWSAADPARSAGCDLRGRSAPVTTPASLRQTPFQQPLTRPPRLHADGDGVHRLVLRRADVQLVPGVPTPMLTYNGVYPAPTILARVGEPLRMEARNALDEDAVLHLHGGHTPAASDGHVMSRFAPGTARQFDYPNTQRAATLWYHDHLLMRTSERVYRGLAGMYLLLDQVEEALGLPVGDERDVEVMLADKTFAGDGTLAYGDPAHTGFRGDVVLVNGVERPHLAVAPGRLRLRLLNASNARPYRLQRLDGNPLLQIAGDGGLLAAPVERPWLELWPAQRAEVLLDLAAIGDPVVLADALAGPDDPGLLRIDVTDGPDPQVFSTPSFPALDELGPPEVTRTVRLSLERGRWLINGHGYDDAITDWFPRLGAVERWRVVNESPAAHPFHIHLAHFLVRSRVRVGGAALPPRPEDEGWVDTFVVNGQEVVEVDGRFDRLGPYMVHCHILEHEDHDMMSQFRVVDLSRVAGRNRVETAALLAERVVGPVGTIAVTTALDWRSALVAAALADVLLLVAGPTLDPAVRAQVERLAPAEVVIVGPTGEVSSAVQDELASVAAVRRITAESPSALAAAVAASLVGRAPEVVLATASVFPDALAAGALGIPVLLTDPGELPDVTLRALDDLDVRSVLIAGGYAAVRPPVEDAVLSSGRQVTRVAGATRFETAAMFAARAGPADQTFAVSGERFPDALAAMPVARREKAPVVLLGDTTISSASAEVVTRAGATRAVIVGGEQAVPLAAETALAALLPGPAVS